MEDGKPHRHLDGFTLFTREEPHVMREMELLDAGGRSRKPKLLAQGYVVRPPGAPSTLPERLPVEINDLNDWCLDYGNPPGLWLVSPRAWYLAKTSSPEYLHIYKSARRKFELCLRAAKIITANPAITYQDSYERILCPRPDEKYPCDSGTVYDEEELIDETTFVRRQLRVIGGGDQSNSDEDEEELRKRRRRGDCGTGPAAPWLHMLQNRGRAMQRSKAKEIVKEKRIMKRILEPMPPRVNTTPPEGTKWWVEPPANPSAVASRGKPPRPNRDFGVDAPMVPEILSLWTLLNEFGQYLQLPPFPMWRLVNAICVPAPGGTHHGGDASGVLLRDVHQALLRAYEGKDIKVHAQPQDAQVGDVTVPWAVSVRTLLMEQEKELLKDPSGERALEACKLMSDGADYADLKADARLAVLTALSHLATSKSDPFQLFVTRRIEAVGNKGRGAFETRVANLQFEEALAAGIRRGGGSKRKPSQQENPWDAWMEWFDEACIAPSRALGYDADGRRYFVLGAVSGWGKVFVEDVANGGFGWYEIADGGVKSLVDWLRKGKAFQGDVSAGVPPSDEFDLAATLFDLVAHFDGHHLGDLADKGPDGYRNACVPLLRGVEPDKLFEKLDQQVRASLAYMMGAIDFWEMDEEFQGRMQQACVLFHRAEGVGSFAAAIGECEKVLYEGKVLHSAWGGARSKFQARQRTARSMQDVAGLAGELENALLPNSERLSREPFYRMVRQAQNTSFIPRAGESVTLLKTGLRLHIDRYSLNISTAQFDSMRFAEQYLIAAVAYRRAREDLGEGHESFSRQWLLLSPLFPRRDGPARQVLPILTGNDLPDYLVHVEAYNNSLRQPWQINCRARMFFLTGYRPDGARLGRFYKGTLITMRRPEQGVDFDPWECLGIEWDKKDKSYRARTDEHGNVIHDVQDVSPWELELDPENERRMAIERAREEAAQRSKKLRQENDQDAKLARYQRAEARADPTKPKPLRPTPPEKRKRSGYMPMPTELVGASKAVPVPPRATFLEDLRSHHQALGGELRVPFFCREELDLHRVFVEVQNRGGYHVVTDGKMWREVCRSLGVDLTGQTSASFTMRNNFEKCLLTFERSLAGELPEDTSYLLPQLSRKRRAVVDEEGNAIIGEDGEQVYEEEEYYEGEEDEEDYPDAGEQDDYEEDDDYGPTAPQDEPLPAGAPPPTYVPPPAYVPKPADAPQPPPAVAPPPAPAHTVRAPMDQ